MAAASGRTDRFLSWFAPGVGEELEPVGSEFACWRDVAVERLAGDPEARLLLLCVLFRSSWLAAEGGRQVGAATVLHRRGGRAGVAVSVGVAVGVPQQLFMTSDPPSRRFRSAGDRQSVERRLPLVEQTSRRPVLRACP